MTLSIAAGADKVNVWLNANKSGLGPILGGLVTQKTWDLGQQPDSVHVEGISGSLAVGDISFLLAAGPPSVPPATDTAKATAMSLIVTDNSDGTNYKQVEVGSNEVFYIADIGQGYGQAKIHAEIPAENTLWSLAGPDGEVVEGGDFTTNDDVVTLATGDEYTLKVGLDENGNGFLDAAGEILFAQPIVPVGVQIFERPGANGEPGGFDTVAGVKWLMVPKGGINSFVALITPGNAFNQIAYVSTIPATANPGNPGNPVFAAGQVAVSVPVNGLVKAENAVVQARLKNPNAPGGVAAGVLDSVNITVKNPKTITVAVFSIADGNHGANQIPFPAPPNVAQLTDKFFNTFTRQAAINVNVLPLQDLRNVNYDINQDGQLNARAVDNGAEYNLIVNNPQVTAVQADYKIFFVDNINPAPAIFALPGVPAELYGTAAVNTASAAVGTYDRFNPVALAPDFLTSTAAHELGHLLGLQHTVLSNHLMTADLANNPNNRYELDKNEWDIINP